jgi:hypothetical protein
MTNHPYLLFNQTPDQLRRIGARGGKAQARNRRARQQAQAQPPPPAPGGIAPLLQTAAQASRFWMLSFLGSAGAEKRCLPGTRDQSSVARPAVRINAL